MAACEDWLLLCEVLLEEGISFLLTDEYFRDVDANLDSGGGIKILVVVYGFYKKKGITYQNSDI